MAEKITAKCIYCGYEMEIDKEKFVTGCYCQYCGNHVNIENDEIVSDTDREEDEAIAKRIEEYNDSLKVWNKASFIIGLLKFICGGLTWVIVLFGDTVSVGWLLSLFMGITFFVFGPISIAHTQPDGSKIDGAGLRKPRRILTALKYYGVFILLEVIAATISLMTFIITPDV